MSDSLHQLIGRHRSDPLPERKPSWLRVKAPGRANYGRPKGLMKELDLHTVCEEARCPKPHRVATAIAEMNLRHAFITSVDRDDLPDFGADIFAEIIRQIHARLPTCSVEVLVPDFHGNEEAIRAVLAAEPEIDNRNTETVPRLYKRARPGGLYERVLNIFRFAKRVAPHIPTKTGIIVGLGETVEEIVAVMRDLRSVIVDILTLGQYLRPSDGHLPLDRYYTPDEFRELQTIGMSMVFRHVESGPLVRSSYHAWEQVQAAGV